MRSRKKERTCAEIKKIDQVARTTNIAAHHADRFAQRADLDVNSPVHIEMIDRAASSAAEHARRVRVIDHHDAIVFVGEVAELRQRRDVAIHRKDAVGNDELVALPVVGFLQVAFTVGDLFVF